jgi:hypothetical protein
VSIALQNEGEGEREGGRGRRRRRRRRRRGGEGRRRGGGGGGEVEGRRREGGGAPRTQLILNQPSTQVHVPRQVWRNSMQVKCFCLRTKGISSIITLNASYVSVGRICGLIL